MTTSRLRAAGDHTGELPSVSGRRTGRGSKEPTTDSETTLSWDRVRNYQVMCVSVRKIVPPESPEIKRREVIGTLLGGRIGE